MDEKNSCCSGVPESKAFPHNLRHLFARQFYRQTGDIVKLADVLGHSSIETTRISKRADFECDTYYNYLRSLTAVMDIYDFSDMTEINANPYNFRDSGHYNDIMGEKFEELLGEYRNTGTIRYQSYDSESRAKE